MKIPNIFLLVLLFLFAGHPAPARGYPVSPELARHAASRFVEGRFNKKVIRGARALRPETPPQVETLSSAAGGAEPLAFVAKPSTGGFILVRPDDRAPPVKLYSESGSFEDLPPAFKQIILLELEEESQFLKAHDSGSAATETESANQEQWSELATASAPETGAPPSGGSEGLVLVPQRWNQNSPYNYYAPVVAGGPGGRAYIGCTATALGQILRYHTYPPALLQDRSYTDSSGSLQGVNTASSIGLGNYDWANMPASINSGSLLAQKQAIGQLLYHAAVTLTSNFEAGGTSAYPSDIPYVLAQYYGYNSGNFEYKSSYTSPQWYQKIAADIDSGRPVFYAMWQADWSAGHAVVCDGYRNSNEIHLNLGWSGSYDAWYNIDSVQASSYNWTRHSAVTGIKPVGIPVLAVSPPTLNFGSQPLNTPADLSFTVENTGSGTLSGSVSVVSPFSVVAGGNYTLEAGQTQAVTVRFNPGAASAYSRTITFTGAAGSSRTVAGTGIDATATPTATATHTQTATWTPTATPTPTGTLTETPTPTVTPAVSPTETATITPTTPSLPSLSPTATPLPTETATGTPTFTATPLATYTATPDYGEPTATPTAVPTQSEPQQDPVLPDIEQTPVALPDLVVPYVRAAVAGKRSYMQVSFAVKNQQPGTSVDSAAGIYLMYRSGSTQYRTSRVKLQPLPGIEAGATFRATTRITIPPTLRRSKLAVKVVADALKGVNEANEMNNSRVQTSYSVLRSH